MERRLKDLEYSMNEADEELLKMKKVTYKCIEILLSSFFL